MDALVPLIVALTGLPALGLAAWTGGRDEPHARGLGLRWALVALCAFLGAGALYWAGGSQPRVYAVAIMLVIAVNALLVSMVLHLRRGGDGKHPR